MVAKTVHPQQYPRAPQSKPDSRTGTREGSGDDTDQASGLQTASVPEQPASRQLRSPDKDDDADPGDIVVQDPPGLLDPLLLRVHQRKGNCPRPVAAVLRSRFRRRLAFHRRAPLGLRNGFPRGDPGTRQSAPHLERGIKPTPSRASGGRTPGFYSWIFQTS